jgi:hypothetical protein
MAPVERLLPRFAAEPPQEELPYGRWEERLREQFLDAAARIEGAPADLGDADAVVWYPDRSWHGYTYVPATARTTGGYELFGYVRFAAAGAGAHEQPEEFLAQADFTEETAERNPDWQLDLCEEVVGSWRGQLGAVASMTLVWGRSLVSGGRLVTGELADLAVDQCELIAERFTLLAPDDYRGDLLEIKLWDVRGRELARESLYSEEDEADEPAADGASTEQSGEGESAAEE